MVTSNNHAAKVKGAVTTEVGVVQGIIRWVAFAAIVALLGAMVVAQRNGGFAEHSRKLDEQRQSNQTVEEPAADSELANPANPSADQGVDLLSDAHRTAGVGDSFDPNAPVATVPAG